MHFEVDGLVIRHRINRRLKHAYLQVEHDGSVLLKSNGRNASSLKAFVASRVGWIREQQQKLSLQPGMELGATLLFMGETLPLEQLDIRCGRTGGEQAMRRAYDRFYKARSEAMLLEKTRLFAQRMNVDVKMVRFRKMKRRWGSCSKAGVVTFNTLLLQLPEPMIDYTVVHELAHRIHFNHSADFHNKVSEFIPDEKALRAAMRYRKAVLY